MNAYVYAAMLLQKSGKVVTEGSLSAVIGAAGGAVDREVLGFFVKSWNSVDVPAVLAQLEKEKQVAAIQPVAAEPKEEKKEEEKKEDYGTGGLADLFGTA